MPGDRTDTDSDSVLAQFRNHTTMKSDAYARTGNPDGQRPVFRRLCPDCS